MKDVFRIKGRFVVLLATLSTAALAEQRFVDVSPDAPSYFQTGDGRAWIPVGCNICFERLYGTEDNGRAACEERYFARMRKFAANGGNFLRIWLGHPFFEVMPSTAGEYDPAATETLKKTVRLAEELGIKLKFTLESFRSVLPADKVGKGLYAAFFNRPLYAPYAKNMREFYASEKCFEIYLGKARYLKSLGLGDSPAVICWELWNEINSTGSVDAYADWSDRMLAALGALFPRQMVTQNLGSFSGVDAFRIYDYLGRVRENAFMQVHRYLDPGASLDVCRGPMDVLCAEAVRELRDRRPDRPALLAEVGAVRANHTGPSDLYDLDAKGMLLHDEIFAAFFAGAAGCGQPWHWDHQYLDRHDLWYHFARFAKATEGLDPIAEKFRPFRTETRRLRIYGLKGRRTTVLWCRDKANTWEAEYGNGIPPETLRDVKLPFSSHEGFSVYLPWEDRTVSLPAGRCVLPPFQRSCTVRFAETPEVRPATVATNLTPQARAFVVNLMRIADSGRFVYSWTHPWQETDAAFRAPEGDGWRAKAPDEFVFASRFNSLTGEAPVMYFSDLRFVVGSYLGEAAYARNRASLTAMIRKAWHDYQAVPVFSWHVENPYVPNGWKDPKHGEAPYRYRSASTGYPQANRYVFREILEGTGGPCGFGRQSRLHAAAPVATNANPRAWYDARLGEIAAFLNGLTGTDGEPIPAVVRLFHECEDDWSWWGIGSVSVKDYVELFRYTVTHLRKLTGGANLLFAYSPDRYWWRFGTEGDGDAHSFMGRYPGDGFVDVIGYDDYQIGTGTNAQIVAKRQESAVEKMRLITAEARRRGKACGLFESGAINAARPDYYDWLYKALTAEGVGFSFVNMWGGYEIPLTPEGKDSLKRFLQKPEVVTYRDGINLTDPTILGRGKRGCPSQSSARKN